MNSCYSGWNGDDCSECVTLPECKHGYCKDNPNTCICKEGWAGHLCDQPVCQ